MDEIKGITKNALYETAATKGFGKEFIAKDYVLTEILFLLKDTPNIYFKGGTAIQKAFLHHSRLSEDIDFTITKSVKEIDSQITKILKDSKLFTRISHDKDVAGFTRIVVGYHLFDEIRGEVFIDLNERAKVLLKPEKHPIEHFYQPSIPAFSVNTLALEELIAEKLSAAITRNKPRDHFDIYQLIKAGHKINHKLARQKCEAAGAEFSILKLFNNAKTLKNRWDADMIPLIAEEVEFTTVMRFLANHFNLKQEKEKARKKQNM